MGAKAWLVTWAKDTDSASIVCAASRGQARAVFLRSARDASVDVDWCAVQVVRAPDYDPLSRKPTYLLRPIMLHYASLYLAQLCAADNVT